MSYSCLIAKGRGKAVPPMPSPTAMPKHWPKFKTDNWQTVGECLSLNPQLTWGAVVDLSNFFLHLGLHPSAGRWIRIKKEMGDFQWTALPFGLQCSPYWTGRFAQVVEKTLRLQEAHLIWYADDILILGESQQSVSTNLEILLHTCNEAGLIVYKKKSQLTPSQHVSYLGQQIIMRTRMVGP